MKTKFVEYLADLLPDGHLSIPEKIRRKLKRISKKKVKVRIKLETESVAKKGHPAFGIWADRLSESSSIEMAEALRKMLENRADGSQ